MKTTRKNQLAKARSLKVGEMAIIEFEDYGKYRSFTVQLSYYNAGLGRKRNLYVHAASNKKKLQYFLYVVTADEKDREDSDSNLKGQWKKVIPEEWRSAC